MYLYNDSMSNVTKLSPVSTEPPPYWFDGFDASSGFCDWYNDVDPSYKLDIHPFIYNLLCNHSNNGNESSSSWLQRLTTGTVTTTTTVLSGDIHGDVLDDYSCDWYNDVGQNYESTFDYAFYNLYCNHYNNDSSYEYNNWFHRLPSLSYVPELEYSSMTDDDYNVYQLLLKISIYLNYCFTTPLSILLSCLGMVGNAIILVIFRRLGVLADCCTPILVGLAASDFTYCLLSFVIHWMQVALFTLADDQYDFIHTVSVVQGIFHKPIPCLVQFTCWATAFLAFERMFSVVFPFRVKQTFTPKRTCIITVVIFVLGFLANLHTFLDSFLEFNEQHGLKWSATGYVSDSWAEEAGFANDVILRLLSIVLVITLNLVIIIRVNALKTKRNSNASSSTTTRDMNRNRENDKTKKETKLTRMMIVLCVLFVACYTPKTVFIFSLEHGESMSMIVQFIVQVYSLHLSAVFELFNSAVTFAIYNTMSSKFKMERRKLCLGCRRGSDGGDNK